MTESLMKLFKQKVHKQINVSFYRLDPATKKLIVYNSEKPLDRLELLVKDEYGDKYQTLIPSMEANQEFLLPIEKIVDDNGTALKGEIITITVRFENHTEHFKLYGREFHRA